MRALRSLQGNSTEEKYRYLNHECDFHSKPHPHHLNQECMPFRRPACMSNVRNQTASGEANGRNLTFNPIKFERADKRNDREWFKDNYEQFEKDMDRRATITVFDWSNYWEWKPEFKEAYRERPKDVPEKEHSKGAEVAFGAGSDVGFSAESPVSFDIPTRNIERERDTNEDAEKVHVKRHEPYVIPTPRRDVNRGNGEQPEFFWQKDDEEMYLYWRLLEELGNRQEKRFGHASVGCTG